MKVEIYRRLLMPALLKVRLLSNWRRHPNQHRVVIENLILFGLSAFLAIAIFASMADGIGRWNLDGGMIGSSERMISLVFFSSFMACMLIAIPTAANVLFFSKDNELILKAPDGLARIATARFIESFIQPFWMQICIFIPILAGVSYGLYGVGVGLLVILFAAIILAALTTAWSMILIICGFYLLPTKRVKQMTVGAIILLVPIFYLLARLLQKDLLQSEEKELVPTLIQIAHSPLFISRWLQEICRPNNWLSGSWSLSFAAIVCSLVGSLVVLKIVAVRLLSKSFAKLAFFKIDRQRRLVVIRHFAGLFSAVGMGVEWAMLGKELKTLLRDFMQSFQFVLILGLSFVYLYNLGFQQGNERMDDNARTLWALLLYIANVLFGASIILAINARFVVHTFSFDSAYSWLYGASPVPLKRIVWAKFLSWNLLCLPITVLIFGLGAFALKESGVAIALTCLLGVLISGTLCSLALAIGASHYQAHWQHISQLTGSMATLMYFGLGGVLSIFLLVPIIVMTGTLAAQHISQVQVVHPYLVVAGGVLILGLIFLTVTYFSLRHSTKMLKGTMFQTA